MIFFSTKGGTALQLHPPDTLYTGSRDIVYRISYKPEVEMRRVIPAYFLRLIVLVIFEIVSCFTKLQTAILFLFPRIPSLKICTYTLTRKSQLRRIIIPLL